MGLTASAERLDQHLLPYIASVQAMYPDRLLARGQICNMAADLLSVSRQVVLARITEAITSGKLIEVRPRADWLVTLPEGDDLPDLYAVPNPTSKATYDLRADAPLSRGAGGSSFLLTPDGLRELLALTRMRYGLPEPDDMKHYTPVIERRLRPDDYKRLRMVLIQKYPESLTAAQPDDILDEMLSVLRLKAPHRS
jgi:hypothetical protein